MKIAKVKGGYRLSTYQGKGLPQKLKEMLEGAIVLRSISDITFEQSLIDSDKPEHTEEAKLAWYSNGFSHIFYIDLDKLYGTAIWDYIEFVEVLNMESELGELIMETQADRLKKLEREPRSVVNELCNVSVGGSAIDITQVQVLTDLCTEELQRQLNDGWRIVAVCVQPDQRRPDYVLGKR